MLECVTHSHRTPLCGELIKREEVENYTMRHIRTSVEWPYETATNLFHILQSKHLKRMLRHNRVPNDIVCKQLRVIFSL
jgi:hypothetical protein